MSAGCSRPFNWFSELSFRSGYYQIFDTSRCTRQDALEYFLCPNFVVTETVTASMKLKNACSLEGKLWQCIKKQRYHFANKGLFSQSYGFSSSHVWMWELPIKKAELRIDAFELWCWRRLLRVPWTARSSNQSILKEIHSEYSLEGLMLKLKL